MSLLMAEGHPDARNYPLPMLIAETRIVGKRKAQELAGQMALTNLAVGAVISKEGSKLFREKIEKMLE